YGDMLRNPRTGDGRGTFALATWDAGAGRAHKWEPGGNDVKPMVLQSANNYSTSWNAYGEVLDKAGCKIQSCPFVFVTVLFEEITTPGYTDPFGQTFNYGHNGGGGYVHLKASYVRDHGEMQLT